MEFLRRLFGGQAQPATAASHAPAPPPVSASLTTYGDRIAQVDALDLMGPYVRSPDGRLMLVCGTIISAGNSSQRQGGYAVLEGRRIVVSGRAERPQEGSIADNGVFIFNDWLNNDALAGRFMAFRPDGGAIIAQHFDANLMGNGLSADGRYAICQTAQAPGSADSCIVAVFDLLAGRELARWQPACGTAKDFEFDVETGAIRLLTQDGDRETYDLASGAMRDRDAWQARRIANGDLPVIGDLLKGATELEPDLLDRVRQGLAVAQSPKNGWSSARAYRLEGELMERLGRPDDALGAYEQALLIDPQVGVAKRASALKRATAGPATSPAPRKNRFEQHAARLGIRHEQIVLEKAEPKSWRHEDGAPFTVVELAALAHYERDGWSGCAAEGGLILTLIKAASFERLDPRNADTFIEALYHQNVAFPEDRFDPDTLVATVATADLARIRRNWDVISRTAGHAPAFYPRVGQDHVMGLYSTLGAARLAAIAKIFATAPYDLRAGWPDLTLWRGTELRFVEVKSPSDQMHASQARLISTLLVPLGFETILAEVKARA